MRRLSVAGFALLLGACGTTPPGPSPSTASEHSDRSARRAAMRSAVTVTEEPWSLGYAPGTVVRTEHYRLFTTIDDERARRRTAIFLERALAHYRSAIVRLPAPPMRLDTYFLASRDQWETVTRRLMGAAASSTLLQIGRGGYAARGVGVYWDIGRRDTLGLAAHEGWHQYTQRTFKQSLPPWLEEGIATYMEGHRWLGPEAQFMPWANLQRFDQLRRAAASGTLLELEELLDATPAQFLGSASDTGLTYYAQLWALTHFLASSQNDHGQALEDLLLEAAEGMLLRRVALVPDAGRHGLGKATYLAYFNRDLKTENARFQAFVRRIVATGGRERVVSGLGPE